MEQLTPTVWRWSSRPNVDGNHPQTHAVRVAMFDLDDTLIISNRRPKSSSDFTFMPDIKDHLISLVQQGIPIVIVTNQGGISHGNVKVLPRITAIMQAMASFLHVDEKPPSILQCYVAGAYDIYRKPMTGLFEQYIWPTFPKAMHWSYVGDAAGRANDFSSTDRKFAYNVDLIFQYLKNHNPSTDESLKTLVSRVYPNGRELGGERPRLAFQVPEECFPNGPATADAHAREWWGFYPGGFLKQLDAKGVKETLSAQLAKIQAEVSKGLTEIVMIGAQGAGKSYVGRTIAEKTKAVLVSRDNYSTQNKFMEQVKKHLSAGRSVILDATHPTRVSRSAATLNMPACQVIFVYVNTPRHIAYHLNRTRMWYGDKCVPEAAHHKFYNDLQLPETYIELPFYPEFASSDERFRFLQFTEEGAQFRMSTQED